MPLSEYDTKEALRAATDWLVASELPGSAAANGAPGRKHFGYIVGVYYHNELQDFRADPASLAKDFPLQLYLKEGGG